MTNIRLEKQMHEIVGSSCSNGTAWMYEITILDERMKVIFFVNTEISEEYVQVWVEDCLEIPMDVRLNLSWDLLRDEFKKKKELYYAK